MARSLGSAAYRALMRRGTPPATPDWPKRPAGELVWIHAAEAGSMSRATDLAQRLITARFGVSVLLSTPDQSQVAASHEEADDIAPLTLTQAPTEHPGSVAAFVQHWHPEAAIWLWGDLRPNLIHATADSGAAMILADAGADGFLKRRDRWLPEVPRGVLARFDHVLARTPEAATRLRQLGCGSGQLEQTLPLVTGGQILPAALSDVDDLSQAMRGRPVWFAAGALADEVPALIVAHRGAQRMSHRLLLIIEPQDADADAAVEELCRGDEVRFVRWSDGAPPDDTTSVMLADIPGETGLWLRVSPIVFLGGSLVPGQGGQDPFAAASSGSAILYGPGVGQHLDAYSRLANAGAARIVNDTESLGTAVTQLIAPDQAAKMAIAGWDVVTQGATATDRIIDLVQPCIDRAEGAR